MDGFKFEEAELVLGLVTLMLPGLDKVDAMMGATGEVAVKASSDSVLTDILDLVLPIEVENRAALPPTRPIPRESSSD